MDDYDYIGFACNLRRTHSTFSKHLMIYSRDLVNVVLTKIPHQLSLLCNTSTSAILRFQLTVNSTYMTRGSNSLGKIIFFPPSPKYTQLKELNIFAPPL